MLRVFFILLLLSGLAGSSHICAQAAATISESTVEFMTYPFHDPDPVPSLVSKPSIYPYHRFEGYSHTAQPQPWKVVKLENEYIEVHVLPEIGGKVWGAIEKSTGEEFIYRNEVVKFRNIAMRGPWTSGGIEFNFGIIGHHPMTATPVDYVLRNHEDGSVSCVVGALDLPSRTQWRVEIVVSPGKAYFETRALWYNPTSEWQPYYHWMTAAAEARSDLQFYAPGHLYLEHSGKEQSWPTDDLGRDLSKYAENAFGGSKSYHVVGAYDDFFGGYFHDKNVGFGHWSPYGDMPGQKLWIWALSRSGAIWEDLLTDGDGQYIEFQAGRLFNQYSPGTDVNPITQVSFEPGRADLWRELWFPVRGTGGISHVSPKAVLHTYSQGDSLVVAINALEQVDGPVQVVLDDELPMVFEVALHPMQTLHHKVPGKPSQVRITSEALQFDYCSEPKTIARPFGSATPEMQTLRALPTAENLYRRAVEFEKLNELDAAAGLIDQVLLLEPFHLGALQCMMGIKYRQASYDAALELGHKALAMDTYDPMTNFLIAKVYTARGDDLNTEEALQWAARSIAYRAEAMSQLAELYLRQGRLEKANQTATAALEYNRYHMGARSVLAVVARKMQSASAAIRHIATLRSIDPLHQLAKMEQYLISQHPNDLRAVIESHRSEMPYQTYLELALHYLRLGCRDEAGAVLALSPDHPLIHIYRAWLQHDDSLLAVATAMPVEHSFPYRRETLPVLQWALGQRPCWQFRYLLALNSWALGHRDRALNIISDITEGVPSVAFYLTRAHLKSTAAADPADDLLHAVQLDKQDWRAWQKLIEYYLENRHTDALLAAEEAFRLHPRHYSIGMLYARALVDAGKVLAAIDLLKGLKVLPFEGAYTGREVWEHAHLHAALDLLAEGQYTKALDMLNGARTWPETLGVGKPYHPDERLIDYLAAYAAHKLKRTTDAQRHYEAFRKQQQVTRPEASWHALLDKHARIWMPDQQIAHQDTESWGVIADFVRAYADGDHAAMTLLKQMESHIFKAPAGRLFLKVISLP